MRVIDFTMPISSHWRWMVSLETVRDFGPDSPFHISEFHCNIHAFTHIDAPLHVTPDAQSIDRVPLERLVGPAAVIDLSDKGPGEPIRREDLDRRGEHVHESDIVLLKTCWDSKYLFDSREYWTQACYVTDEAANWLFERSPSAVGYDFPQDHILQGYDGHSDPATSRDHRLEEFTTHHLLLARGIPNIEYLGNLHKLDAKRSLVVALPILLRGGEAAPARVVAVEL